MPSVDVAIPCFNHGRYLGDCIASVLAQDIDNLRVLIIDNASTDGSLDVARQFAAADRRVEIRARESNLGPTRSFNESVDWARADYFMILCSDDLLEQGSLKRAMFIMESHREVVFAYGEDVQISGEASASDLCSADGDPRWQIWEGSRFIRDRCRNPQRYIAAGMVLVRTAAQKAAGHFRPELPHTDDLEMLLRLACLGHVACTDAVQGIKRMHETNRTHEFLVDRTSDLVERVIAIESFFANEGRELADAERLRRLAIRSIAERSYWCGVGDICRRRAGAGDLFKLAFRLSPVTAIIPPLNYFARMNRPAQRIGAILTEALGLRRPKAGTRRSVRVHQNGLDGR